MDRYRDQRSPDRERFRAPPTDSYVPSSNRSARPRSRSPGRYRPRSRTPPRVQGDSWRSRPRSRSPARRYEAREDTYPPRDAQLRASYRGHPAETRRDDDARQSRGKSPTPLKRSREPSLPGRSRRSPPPVKRERLDSIPRDYAPRNRSPAGPLATRDEYRPRSRTPARRDDRFDQYDTRSFRRRSPSTHRGRHDARATEGSGHESRATSRRSSPRPPARAHEVYEDTRPSAAFHRSPIRVRSPAPASAVGRTETTSAARAMSPQPRDAPSDSRFTAQTSAEQGYGKDRNYSSTSGEAATPTGPSFKDRPPPTGPASSSRQSTAAPPTGPSGTPVSMSAHSRPASTLPPTYPRGSGYRGRGGPPGLRDYTTRDYPNVSSPLRGGRAGWPSAPHGRAALSPHDGQEPRMGPPGARGRDTAFSPPSAGFRGHGNSTSTTYPRTQRFNTSIPVSAHLSDLPSIKNGGERLPPLHDMSKADRLEEEAARLRKLIDEKQEHKRDSLREWESLERQTKSAGLRTELAEESLRGFNEEGSGIGVGGVAAF